MKLISHGTNSSEIMYANGTSVLFSYQTPVAVSIGNPSKSVGLVGVYKTSEKYSRTTSKHINAWTATTKTLSQVDLERLIEQVIV
jgi:hypothetical protein